MPPRTPTKRSPPKPPRDKMEMSPNNRAKCHMCGDKILKGTERYGIVERNAYGSTQRYFHPKCCPADLHERFTPEKRKQDMLLEERKELADDLQSLRSLFAAALDVEPYRIFHNKSMYELVAKLPTTEADLLNIWGIKEQKVQSFGGAILDVIEQYKRRQHNPLATTKRKIFQQKHKKQNALGDNNIKGDTDNDIAMGDTLTCEQIVQRKFEHARENGYVISVD